jgi:hypothetical protein
MNNEDKSLDLLGVKPVGEAVNAVTQGAVQGTGAFLSRICLPAAEEFGLLLRDKVREWRATNLEKIAQEAERRVAAAGIRDATAHPRLVHQILEHGSWSEDDTIQKMWAGLLASSCTEKRSDDGNLIFVTILAQLTSAQVRILNYACENAPKYLSKAGLPFAKEISVEQADLMKLSNIDNVHRLDRELDCLRALELIGAGGFGGRGGGLDAESGVALLCPSAVALHLYVKSQGFHGSPVEYWSLNQQSIPVDQVTE